MRGWSLKSGLVALKYGSFTWKPRQALEEEMAFTQIRLVYIPINSYIVLQQTLSTYLTISDVSESANIHLHLYYLPHKLTHF